MEFEFDAEKSFRNKIKHGIDFVEAQSIWDDPERIEIPAKTEDEARYLVIGRIGDRHWSAVITYRGLRTRVISARRARKEEKRLYESQGI
ncbi:MAG: hypothetical protein H6Q52_2769 [Deltaproteobacteria bacterium]|nr:hypothetical protein [Deltaproteobacteria bacterium]